MSKPLSRREFLKLSAASALGLLVGGRLLGNEPIFVRRPLSSLGRVIYSLRYYERPTTESRELGYYVRDTVIEVLGEALGEAKPKHNPIWYLTPQGWVHSSYVQPVRWELQQPVARVPAGGMLAEVSVPFTQAYRVDERGMRRVYRCYYASTYWVHGVFTSQTGKAWYRIWDERTREHYIVEAQHLRPITEEELTPISPGIKDKRIEVNLELQRLTAYEGRVPVLTTRIASGYFEGDTPRGEFRIERKQPTRHMASDLEGNGFDLPGVPWVCYISWTGVSTHGTYWHNNYGAPQSHGCINLTPEAAKWLYRWTEPYVPFDEDYVETDHGTRVIVF